MAMEARRRYFVVYCKLSSCGKKLMVIDSEKVRIDGLVTCPECRAEQRIQIDDVILYTIVQIGMTDEEGGIFRP